MATIRALCNAIRSASEWIRYKQALKLLHSINGSIRTDLKLYPGDFHTIARSYAYRKPYTRLGQIQLCELNDRHLPDCIRFAKTLDAADVHARFGLALDLSDELTCRKYLLGSRNPGTIVLGYFSLSGSVVAIGQLSPGIGNSGEVAVIVRPDLRDQRVGYSLLYALINRARRAGYSALVARTETRNRAAFRLLNACHFDHRSGPSASSLQWQLSLDV